MGRGSQPSFLFTLTLTCGDDNKDDRLSSYLPRAEVVTKPRRTRPAQITASATEREGLTWMPGKFFFKSALIFCSMKKKHAKVMSADTNCWGGVGG